VRSVRLYAVILGHLAFAGAVYAMFAIGFKLAPELMMADVMLYPLILGVVGIWIWFGFWSYGVLKADRGDKHPLPNPPPQGE